MRESKRVLTLSNALGATVNKLRGIFKVKSDFEVIDSLIKDAIIKYEKNAKASCDHIMAHGYEGEWDGFVLESGMDEIAGLIIGKCKDWYKAPGGEGYIKKNMEKCESAYDFLFYDLEVFAYCPDCGAKLDWSKYKNDKQGVLFNHDKGENV